MNHAEQECLDREILFPWKTLQDEAAVLIAKV